MDFREKNPLITAQWRRHDNAFKSSIGEDYEIDIASGRTLGFYDIRSELDGVTCKTQKGAKRRSYMYGANIFQNGIQALARDCFAHHLLEVHEAGYNPVMHVHDELMLEVKDMKVVGAEEAIRHIMTTPPSWLKGVPLEADVNITEHYTK